MTRYRFPQVSDIYGSLREREGLDSKLYFLRQSFRYWLRCFPLKKEINEFSCFVNENKEFIDLFLFRRGGDYRSLCVGFIDKTLSPKERLVWIKDSLLKMRDYFSSELIQKLSRDEMQSIVRTSWGMEVVMRLNGTFEEGFLSLEILFEGERVYGISFGVIAKSCALIIGALQGLDRGEEHREKIKMITKKNHGLRPTALLVELMRGVMQVLDCQKLLGISQTRQMRYSAFGKKGYFVNYDAIWEECGGKIDGAYYNLTSANHKSLGEIPSQKRSMYKKRYELIAQMKEELMARMKEIGVRKNVC